MIGSTLFPSPKTPLPDSLLSSPTTISILPSLPSYPTLLQFPLPIIFRNDFNRFMKNSKSNYNTPKNFIRNTLINTSSPLPNTKPIN
jgi:hypothetical protein